MNSILLTYGPDGAWVASVDGGPAVPCAVDLKQSNLSLKPDPSEPIIGLDTTIRLSFRRWVDGGRNRWQAEVERQTRIGHMLQNFGIYNQDPNMTDEDDDG